MGIYFSLLIIGIECFQFIFHVVNAQCPGSSGPVIIVGTSIVDQAYYQCATVTTATIPSTLTSIGDSVFKYCVYLSKIKLISGLTILGSHMFYMAYGVGYSTSLLSVTIPSTITSVGDLVFTFCSSLTQVTLINGLGLLGNSMFGMGGYPTSLQTVTIPSTITSVADYALALCFSLSQIILINGLTVIGHKMFDLAFYNPTSLESVIIPSTITFIGDYAFRGGTSLTQIILTNGLFILGTQMFIMYNYGNAGNGGYGPSSLGSVMIPSTITSIGSQAFAYITSLNCVYWVGVIINSPTDIFYNSLSMKTCSLTPTVITTPAPSFFQSNNPSTKPTLYPTFVRSVSPSLLPSHYPIDSSPTIIPSKSIKTIPSISPTDIPSYNPSFSVATSMSSTFKPVMIFNMTSSSPSKLVVIKPSLKKRSHLRKHRYNSNRNKNMFRGKVQNIKQVNNEIHKNYFVNLPVEK